MASYNVILSGKNITRVFGYGKKKVIAVNSVDFEIQKGEIVSIVGESGSGKTTLAKIMLGLLKQTSGEIYFNGNLRKLNTYKDRLNYWKNVQAIFQDPFSSFNQFHKIERVLRDCVGLSGLKLTEVGTVSRMREAFDFVNLKYEELYNKYPFELSGGQMQRVMISRIFMLKPNILIADEPTSMIDVCSRATILDMLMKLRTEINMTIVFITHDVGLSYYISDKIFIMEKGKIVERGKAEDIITKPEHPYTIQLLDDVPKLHEAWNLG
jgi:peptide/nickel transport system ATP-binding protein